MPPAVLPPPEVLNTAEAARFLRQSQATLRKLVHAGEVPCARINHHNWVFRRSSLLKWLERIET